MPQFDLGRQLSGLALMQYIPTLLFHSRRTLDSLSVPALELVLGCRLASWLATRWHTRWVTRWSITSTGPSSLARATTAPRELSRPSASPIILLLYWARKPKNVHSFNFGGSRHSKMVFSSELLELLVGLHFLPSLLVLTGCTKITVKTLICFCLQIFVFS